MLYHTWLRSRLRQVAIPRIQLMHSTRKLAPRRRRSRSLLGASYQDYALTFLFDGHRNVCQTAKACQSGFASVAGTAGSLTGASTGQNNTIVCNDVPRVYAAGEMSCDVQVSPNFSVLVSLNGRVDV